MGELRRKRRRRATVVTTYETCLARLEDGKMLKQRIYRGGPGTGIAITSAVQASREFGTFWITHVASGVAICDRKGLERAGEVFAQLVHVTDWKRSIDELRADGYVKKCVDAARAGHAMPRPPRQERLPYADA